MNIIIGYQIKLINLYCYLH